MKRELLTVCLAAALAGACRGDDTASPSAPDSPAPRSSPGTFLRVSNFSPDLTQVDVLIDGGVQFASLAYSRITSYQQIAAGTHVVEGRPSAGQPPLVDPLRAAVTLTTGEAVTVSAVGLQETHSLRLVAIAGSSSTDAGRARLRFVNFIPDFPASMDLAADRTGLLFAGVGFLGSTDYRELDQGNYDFEVRRNGTIEQTILLSQALARNANYTLIAFGSSRRGDLAARVVLDAGAGAPAQRW